MNSNLSPAQARFQLARGWHAKDNAAAAMLGYREALHLQPDLLNASLHLGSLLVENQRFDEALRVYRRALQYHPGESCLLREIAGVALFHEPPELAIRRCELDAIAFPPIDVVPDREPRPFWSVMITVYRRTAYLEQALRSVLDQRIGADEMQIEVVADGPSHPVQTEIEALIRSVTGERVSFYRHPDRAAHPQIFNVCLQRARGFWIHVLHDDDWVAPGFYQALRRGAFQDPAIGAAFCRHTYVDKHGRNLRLSPLEREGPGVIENWLERIACFCRLQTPSMVVRREAYERLGGYSPQAKSVFDWEMWQRLAVHYPVWYEARPLAFFRQSGESESARLTASGEQMADTRRAIDIAQTYLPGPIRDKSAWRAREHYALAAMEIARHQMEAGDLRSARANLRAGVLFNPSNELQQKLTSLLLEVGTQES